MKDYIAENEQILEEWCKKYVENNKNKSYNPEYYFAKDGIMNKGDFSIKKDGTIFRKPSDATCSKENEMWDECPLRVLFLTKDENTNDSEAWDVRTETFYEKGCVALHESKAISGSFFYQNEACLLYGLMNTRPAENGMIKYDDFSWEDALKFSKENIFARINCKKEVGYGKILNNELEVAIKEYYDYLKRQILALDADILVCCGNQNGNNIILNTIYDIYKNEFEYVGCAENKGSGMHYNTKRNKLAIDAYHLAYFKGGLKARYNEIVGMYYEFLKYLKKKGIDFCAFHREE